MSFIQIIEFHTKDTEDFQKIDELDRGWEKATAGRSTVGRTIVTRDRNDPNHYVVVVHFDSYDAAMANSALPETAALAETMNSIVERPMSFLDLDVVDDR